MPLLILQLLGNDVSLEVLEINLLLNSVLLDFVHQFRFEDSVGQLPVSI
jgi:hypothetical protein